jgi:UDP-GlcNAc:undecaprenyl-phosphate GlcNAc-1-phosphate transferase
MHTVEMPLMGGLAIFLAFVAGVFVFCKVDTKVIGMLLGALLIVITGIIDDKYDMNAFLKLFFQIAAALIAIFSGIVIEQIDLFGHVIIFGKFSGAVTLLWIVLLTNAINLIDGLDGLSCGVSTISCFTLLISLAFHLETPYFVLLLIGILAGSCLGFLPFNFNPAKIFMGDTGALFLGYIMSVLSILGCFKLDALVSFWVPFLIFALPLLDTAFAFIRRILKGKSPFSADRGHVHHRLIDKGFDQRHSVLLLYAISGISGISAILISLNNYVGGAAMFVVAVTVLILNLVFGTDKSGFANSRSNNSPDASSGNNTDAE